MLLIRKQIHAPMLGIRHWQSADYAKPIEFDVEGATTRLYVVEDRYTRKSDALQIAMYLVFEIYSENPPDNVLRSLKARGKGTILAAEWVHTLFLTTWSRFEAVLRVYGGLRNLSDFEDRSLRNFFSDRSSLDRDKVQWSTDGKSFHEFAPRIPTGPKRRHELFKGKQVVTPAKWAKLQQYVGRKPLPSEDIMAFHRIWARVYPREKRTPVIESCILLEAILKAHALKILEKRGFSKSKIKNLSDELSFNTCLNLILPLTLSAADARKLHEPLQRVNRLRKIRNDIVHENLDEADISEQEVKDGIDSAIKLISFISRRRHAT